MFSKTRILPFCAFLMSISISSAFAVELKYVPVDTSLYEIGEPYVIVSSEYAKADVQFEAFCDATDSAAIKVTLTKTGHTNRDMIMIVKTSHKGFAGQEGAKVLPKAAGSTKSIEISSGKTVRPVGTATVYIHQLSNLVAEPVKFTFDRPHVNCASIGGATYKDL